MKRKVERSRHPCVYQFGDCMFNEDCTWLDTDAAVCAVWLGKKGCRRGDACVFVHSRNEREVDAFWERRQVPERAKRRKVGGTPTREKKNYFPGWEEGSRVALDDGPDKILKMIFGTHNTLHTTEWHRHAAKLLTATCSRFKTNTIHTIAEKYSKLSVRSDKSFRSTPLWELKKKMVVKRRTAAQFGAEFLEKTVPKEMLPAALQTPLRREIHNFLNGTSSETIDLEVTLREVGEVTWLPSYDITATRTNNNEKLWFFLEVWVQFLVRCVAMPAINKYFPAVAHCVKKGWTTRYPMWFMQVVHSTVLNRSFSKISKAASDVLRYLLKCIETSQIHPPYLHAVLELAIVSDQDPKPFMKIQKRMDPSMLASLSPTVLMRTVRTALQYLLGKSTGQANGVALAKTGSVTVHEGYVEFSKSSGKKTSILEISEVQASPGVPGFLLVKPELGERSVTTDGTLNDEIMQTIRKELDYGVAKVNGRTVVVTPSVNEMTKSVIDEKWTEKILNTDVLGKILEVKKKYENPSWFGVSIWEALPMLTSEFVSTITDHDLDVNNIVETENVCFNERIAGNWSASVPLCVRGIVAHLNIDFLNTSYDPPSGMLLVFSDGNETNMLLKRKVSEKTFFNGVLTPQTKIPVSGCLLDDKLTRVVAVQGKLYKPEIPKLLFSPALNTIESSHRNLHTLCVSFWTDSFRGKETAPNQQQLKCALAQFTNMLTSSVPRDGFCPTCLDVVGTLGGIAASRKGVNRRIKLSIEELFLDIYDAKMVCGAWDVPPCAGCTEVRGLTLI